MSYQAPASEEAHTESSSEADSLDEGSTEEAPPPDFDVCLSASHPLCLECQDLGKNEVQYTLMDDVTM